MSTLEATGYWVKDKQTSLKRLVMRAFSGQFRECYAVAKTLIAQIDPHELRGIRQRHCTAWPYPRMVKYVVRIQTYMEMAVKRAVMLGLTSGPCRRVLDIGCGAGYLLFAARHFGHDVVGIDLPDDPIFSDVIQLLRIPRVEHRVEAFKPLPEFTEPFDVITATAICFNNVRTSRPWRLAEWTYFLDDCRSRLRPGGSIWLELNRDRQQHYKYLDPETADGLRRYPGATVAADKSTINVRT